MPSPDPSNSTPEDRLRRLPDWNVGARDGFTEGVMSDIADDELTSRPLPLFTALLIAATLLIGVAGWRWRASRHADGPAGMGALAVEADAAASELQVEHIFAAEGERPAVALVSAPGAGRRYLLVAGDRIGNPQSTVHSVDANGIVLQRGESSQSISVTDTPGMNCADDTADAYWSWRIGNGPQLSLQSLTPLLAAGDAGAVAFLQTLCARGSAEPLNDEALALLFGARTRADVERMILVAANRQHEGRALVVRRLHELRCPVGDLALRGIAADATDPLQIDALRGVAAVDAPWAVALLQAVAENSEQPAEARREARLALELKAKAREHDDANGTDGVEEGE